MKYKTNPLLLSKSELDKLDLYPKFVNKDNEIYTRLLGTNTKRKLSPYLHALYDFDQYDKSIEASSDEYMLVLKHISHKVVRIPWSIIESDNPLEKLIDYIHLLEKIEMNDEINKALPEIINALNTIDKYYDLLNDKHKESIKDVFRDKLYK